MNFCSLEFDCWIFSWLQVFDGNENEKERLLFNDEKHFVVKEMEVFQRIH
jgi:hypothetical protein